MSDESGDHHTLFDRFAVALGAALVAFMAASLLWFIVKLKSCRGIRVDDGCSFPVPFDFVLYFAGGMALVGFVLGAARTAKFFNAIWGKDRKYGPQ